MILEVYSVVKRVESHMAEMLHTLQDHEATVRPTGRVCRDVGLIPSPVRFASASLLQVLYVCIPLNLIK